MILRKFNDNQLDQNSYVISNKNQGIVIDPGFNFEGIISYLKRKNISDLLIILTHGHFDHIKGIENLAKEYNFDLMISANDKLLLFDDNLNYAKSFGSSFTLPNLNIIEVSESYRLDFLNEEIEFIETPGHTKGGICIKIRDNLFTGDTLFYNSVGRTDLYSGNQKTLFESMKKLTASIGNNAMIHPGHGKSAELNEIKKINPYI